MSFVTGDFLCLSGLNTTGVHTESAIVGGKSMREERMEVGERILKVAARELIKFVGVLFRRHWDWGPGTPSRPRVLLSGSARSQAEM